MRWAELVCRPNGSPRNYLSCWKNKFHTFGFGLLSLLRDYLKIGVQISKAAFRFLHIEREGMEGTEVEGRDKDRKLQIAVRRAKAALLLSSLKSSVNRVFEAANNDKFKTQVKEKMRREIESLRVELVKERLKMKKIKFCGMVDLILQVILVMLISSFFMKLALDFFIFDDESFFCYSAT
ncbi:hypothetical protein Gohar_024088 [Gossypium harknessii]|uniref:Uncharacterized protein n=1 Tax=Gossypium harknessii TaxID=34285 RepID=A0A7J9HEV6_9ROSI|nr:hypothetical protein [Gossypium harknessii]